MSKINEDIITEILDWLWLFHSTNWDSEFRPEAYAYPFTQYSLISQIWTIPAQRIIFRTISLSWKYHWDSIEIALKHRLKGKILSEGIRVLEVSLSHKSLQVQPSWLAVILGYCPTLVELRLRIGPQVNTLFSNSREEARLRNIFTTLQPTLRAIQIEVDEKWTKSKFIMQLFQLVSLNSLDFVAIFCLGEVPKLPQFDSQWGTYNSGRGKIKWPIGTNAPSLTLRQLNQHAESLPRNRLVSPESISFFHDPFPSPHSLNDLLKVIGSDLKEFFVQTRFMSARWPVHSRSTILKCPSLERIIILDESKFRGPVANGVYIHVLESRDWHPFVHASDSSELIPWDDQIQTASHVVKFGSGSSKMAFDRPLYRRPMINENRSLPLCLTGQEDTSGSFGSFFSSRPTPMYFTVFVAVRSDVLNS